MILLKYFSVFIPHNYCIIVVQNKWYVSLVSRRNEWIPSIKVSVIFSLGGSMINMRGLYLCICHTYIHVLQRNVASTFLHITHRHIM